MASKTMKYKIIMQHVLELSETNTRTCDKIILIN